MWKGPEVVPVDIVGLRGLRQCFLCRQMGSQGDIYIVLGIEEYVDGYVTYWKQQ